MPLLLLLLQSPVEKAVSPLLLFGFFLQQQSVQKAKSRFIYRPFHRGWC
jgi:hypothetical protein